MNSENESQKVPLSGIMAAIISAIGLGTLAILVKLGLSLGMRPNEIIQYRFGFGVVLLFSWLFLTNPSHLRIRKQGLLKAAILGFLVYPLQSWCFVMALAYIPASTTSLIFYIYPLATTLLAMLVFKLRPGRIIWLAMGLIGLGCGLIFHDAFAQALDIRGIFYALACMAFFSLYLTLIQVFTRTDEARRLSPWVIMCMALVFTILSPPTRVMDYGLEGLAVALGLGFIPTALAVTLLYKAVSEIGSAYAAIFSSIEPAATVLLASLVLGEAVAWPQLAGMSAIILGIVLPNLRLARQHARMRDKG